MGKAWLQALIKKVWEVSWDMWDHRNEVRTTNITPATMRETENLNEQIIEQFEEGAASLGQKDHHLLANVFNNLGRLRTQCLRQARWFF
jgi:hypothetical protein